MHSNYDQGHAIKKTCLILIGMVICHKIVLLKTHLIDRPSKLPMTETERMMLLESKLELYFILE